MQIFIKSNFYIWIIFFSFGLANPAMPNDKQKKLMHYFQSEYLSSRLKEAAITNDAYLGFSCAYNYNISILSISQQPDTSIIFNKDISPHPQNGIWRIRYEIKRCDQKNIYNVILGGNKTGPPFIRISTPGMTKANSRLAKQMRPYISLAAMQRADLKECANQRFVDTKYLTKETNTLWENMRWRQLVIEIWKIDVCGRLVTLQVGHGSNISNPNRNFAIKKYNKADWVLSGRRVPTSQDPEVIQKLLLKVIKGNRTAVMEYLWTAANREIPHAQTLLAFLFENGIEVDANMDRAAFWALRAAYNDYPPAMRFIASIYEKGTWITKDKRLAGAWKKRAEKAEINAKTQ
ncbi:MAG: hypothetical protein CMM43_00290 [Rhodospirillaceae bacterium]|nr:hypothetical protein [Rhodospirillaceae bacterium]|tara:strand:- start:1042 stop:2085 length:1044 start_codon:yes stop_codon:yes gene_type:complete